MQWPNLYIHSFQWGSQSYIYQVLYMYWQSTLAHTIDCVCSKILNHCLNHGVLFSLFKFFGWKNILNQLENSGLKWRFLFCSTFKFYLMYRLICQEPVHFLSAYMALVSIFFECFNLVCTYNFVAKLELHVSDSHSQLKQLCYFDLSSLGLKFIHSAEMLLQKLIR